MHLSLCLPLDILERAMMSSSDHVDTGTGSTSPEVSFDWSYKIQAHLGLCHFLAFTGLVFNPTQHIQLQFEVMQRPGP